MINQTIKTALENTVLCRGGNPAKESYEYALKMEVAIKQSIIDKLNQIIDEDEDTNESLEKLIIELKS